MSENIPVLDVKVGSNGDPEIESKEPSELWFCCFTTLKDGKPHSYAGIPGGYFEMPELDLEETSPVFETDVKIGKSVKAVARFRFKDRDLYMPLYEKKNNFFVDLWNKIKGIKII